MLRYYRSRRSNGKELFALLDEHHFPGINRTLFIGSLQAGDTPDNTMEKKVYDLLHFLDMFSLMNVDVDELILSGNLPSKQHINLYVQASRFKLEDAKKFITSRSSNSTNVTKKPLTELQFQNLVHRKSDELRGVKPPTVNARLKIAIQYFKFIFKRHAKRPSPESKEDLSEIIGTLENAKRRKSSAGDVSRVLDKEITDHQFEQLISIIRPDHPQNPFKSGKQRNFLIVLVALAAGLRRGAMAKMKIGDLDFTGNCDTLYVKRTPNDPSDPRKRRPQQKTREHQVSLLPELMLDLKAYYDYTRARFPESKSHEFIFVAEKGKRGSYEKGDPLSQNSYNRIMKKLEEVLGFELHPHKLRYHWHKQLDAWAKIAGVSDAVKENVRKEAMGWAPGSKMTSLYNRLQTVKLMKESSIQHQEEMYDAGK